MKTTKALWIVFLAFLANAPLGAHANCSDPTAQTVTNQNAYLIQCQELKKGAPLPYFSPGTCVNPQSSYSGYGLIVFNDDESQAVQAELNTDANDLNAEEAADAALVANYVSVDVLLKPSVDPIRTDTLTVSGCFEQDPQTGKRIFSITAAAVIYQSTTHNPPGDYLPPTKK